MALYSEEILQLARDLTNASLPDDATMRGRWNNPLCGDSIVVAARVVEGRFDTVGFEVQACAVCRASAAAMASELTGRPLSAFDELLEDLERALDDEVEDIAPPLLPLTAVRPFRSRHACVLLPWRALEQASLPAIPKGTESFAEPLDASEGSAWQVALDVVRGGDRAALATLVAVEGSSPNPVGARMVVSSSGEFWGSVSGGCVESAVVQAAMEAMTGTASRSRVISYQISNSQAGEVGLPCGGRIEVHVALAPDEAELAKRAELSGSVLNFTSLETGDMTLAEDDGRHAPQITPDGAAFVERVGTGERLILVGGTHIAQKLAALATELDFEVIVIDPREHLASPSRFPRINLVVKPPETALDDLITPATSVVMLTHDKAIDDPALLVALRSRARYVAALGSRKTQRARLDRLQKQGLRPGELARLHGPAGLAIGAVGAGEIALSILAEVVAERRAPNATQSRVAGVVLAAGSSRRSGDVNKLLQTVDGDVMIRRVVENACAAGLSPCLVVLGHEAARVQAALAGLPVDFVFNEQHDLGMGTSIATGVSKLPPDVSAAIVVLGDMPRVRTEDIEQLVAAHQPSTQHLIVAPEAGRGDEKRIGNPVLWPRRYFAELTALAGDHGAKHVMLRSPGAVLRVPIDHEGVLKDFDKFPADSQEPTSRSNE